MNPDLPNNPPAPLEPQITALLLGELPADHAAALRHAIASDPELAKVFGRLKQTVDLVRETAATTADEASAPAETLKLSGDKREKLLAHFKTVRPREFAKPKKRERHHFTVLELVALVAILAILASMMLPRLASSKSKSKSFAMISNLRQIDGAKQTWAMENHKSPKDVPTFDDIAPYMGRGSGDSRPRPVAGEKYVLGAVEEPPRVELGNKKLEERVNSQFAGVGDGAAPAAPVAPAAPAAPAEPAARSWQVDSESLGAKTWGVNKLEQKIQPDERDRQSVTTLSSQPAPPVALAPAMPPQPVTAPPPPAPPVNLNYAIALPSDTEPGAVDSTKTRKLEESRFAGYLAATQQELDSHNAQRVQISGQVKLGDVPIQYAQRADISGQLGELDNRGKSGQGKIVLPPSDVAGGTLDVAQSAPVALPSADATRKQKVYAYDLQNADPQQAQQVLQNLFADGTSSRGSSGTSQQTTDPLTARQTAAIQSSGSSSSAFGGSAFGNGSVEKMSAIPGGGGGRGGGVGGGGGGGGGAGGTGGAFGGVRLMGGSTPESEAGRFKSFDGSVSAPVVVSTPPPANAPRGELAGNPEWNGTLNQPAPAQTSGNQFVGRYAYTGLPAGDQLDVNLIHNQVEQSTAEARTSDNQIVSQIVPVRSLNAVQLSPDLGPLLPSATPGFALSTETNAVAPGMTSFQNDFVDGFKAAPAAKEPGTAGEVARESTFTPTTGISVGAHAATLVAGQEERTGKFYTGSTKSDVNDLADAQRRAYLKSRSGFLAVDKAWDAPLPGEALRSAGAASHAAPQRAPAAGAITSPWQSVYLGPAGPDVVKNQPIAADNTVVAGDQFGLGTSPAAAPTTTLNGINTYAGGTVVNGGALAVAGQAPREVPPTAGGLSSLIASADTSTSDHFIVMPGAPVVNVPHRLLAPTPLASTPAALVMPRAYARNTNTHGYPEDEAPAAASYDKAIRAQELKVAELQKQDTGPGQTLGPANVTHYNSLKIDNEEQYVKQAELLARLKEMQGNPVALRQALPTAAPDAVLSGLLQDLNSADARLATLKSDLGPDHPEVVRAAKLRDEVNSKVDERVKGIISGMEMQVAASWAVVTNSQARIDEAKAKELKEAANAQADKPLVKPAAPADIPQPEILSRENAFSTFSLNVADVSFKLAAASLEKGVMPDPSTVRSEEFLNAFDYRDPEPPPGVPVGFAFERARDPFAQNRDLLRFSLKTAAQGRQSGCPMNIVLLLDSSGSMERADRVRIIHEALRVLAGQLQPQDRLSVVTFARTARLFVDGVPGSQAAQVADEVGGLTPEGGTNLEEAMNLAYATALRHYLAGGVNRVVLLTDGAANLGNVEPEALKQKVEANRKQGVALDCFGIGWEGYNDDLLEVLSSHGDGRYGFLNTPEEAATDFAGQLAGALHVAAADVKVQVEFNPDRVTSYRQIGYAKHQLTKQQFRDNTVDAAEIGAAESGNALYVVETNPHGEGPLATVRVRYKVPGTGEFREQEWPVPYTGAAVALAQSGPAMRLAATAAGFSEWLASSPFAAEVTPDALLSSLNGVPEVYGADQRPKKLEWMIRQAKSIAGR